MTTNEKKHRPQDTPFALPDKLDVLYRLQVASDRLNDWAQALGTSKQAEQTKLQIQQHAKELNQIAHEINDRLRTK